MSFLKGLLGGKKSEPTPGQIDRFDHEWEETLKRFEIVGEVKGFSFTLHHPQTNQPLAPHEGLNVTFKEWQAIQSPWDRQRLLLGYLVESTERSLKGWQLANLLVSLRLPQKALTLLETQPAPDATTEEYVSYCMAYARTLVYLQRPSEALTWLQKVPQALESGHRHYKTLWADTLYMLGQHQEANAVYPPIQARQNPQALDVVEDMFNELFHFEAGSIPSPVIAIEIAERLTNPDHAKEFWELAEIEFYASPYFRMHHAYYLLQHNDLGRGLAKLVALVQEMPWLREPTINLLQIFEQFNQQGKRIMPELQQELQQRVQNNQWTTEGLHSKKISIQLN